MKRLLSLRRKKSRESKSVAAKCIDHNPETTPPRIINVALNCYANSALQSLLDHNVFVKLGMKFFSSG